MKDMEYWHKLYKKNPEQYRNELIHFLYNPDNEDNCEECPENIGMDGRRPCGQQNCWVDCHCRR